MAVAIMIFVMIMANRNECSFITCMLFSMAAIIQI